MRIALYMRLSREDGSGGEESNSIRMQRILLRDYAEKHFARYSLLEFRDDGYSGTNFNRPQARRMLELARGGGLDCIMVKDFSRFSRDYIELGSYIGQIFPFLGIRFISVNDGYDSADGTGAAGSLDVAFRSLVYDLYSKDLSVKVSASLAVRKEKGQYAIGNCPFGYKKAEDDRHRLVIDKEEAAVVRRIFSMALDGMSCVRIAKQLNLEGVRTPAEFARDRKKGGQEPGDDRRADWSSFAICRILRNEAYAGDMVYGKYYRDGVGGMNHLRPREEWKICRAHHEAIIERDVFDEVQKGRGRRKQKGDGARRPLTGKLVCGGCGKSLCIRKGKQPYYTCQYRYVTGREECIDRIDAAFLEGFVLGEIQMKWYKSGEPEGLWREWRQGLKSRLHRLRKKRRELEARRQLLEERRLHAYERYSLEKSSALLYQQTIHSMLEEEHKAVRELEEAGREIGRVQEELSEEGNGRLLFRYFGVDSLTEENVDQWIHRIVVHGGAQAEIIWKEQKG